MTDEEGEWVDEMPLRRPWPGQKYDWDAIAAMLRTQPGRWRLVRRNIPRSHAYAIRQGKKRSFQPPEDWLTRTIIDPDEHPGTNSRADLYMAFVGAPGAKLRALKVQP